MLQLHLPELLILFCFAAAGVLIAAVLIVQSLLAAFSAADCCFQVSEILVHRHYVVLNHGAEYDHACGRDH